MRNGGGSGMQGVWPEKASTMQGCRARLLLKERSAGISAVRPTGRPAGEASPVFMMLQGSVCRIFLKGGGQVGHRGRNGLPLDSVRCGATAVFRMAAISYSPAGRGSQNGALVFYLLLHV